MTFRAKEAVILDQMVAKSVNTETYELVQLKHCGVPGAVKRKDHKREECFFVKSGTTNKTFDIKFNCVGKHDRVMIPLVVVIEAPKKSNPTEVLRSIPFILSGRRLSDYLHNLYQKKKPVLEQVTSALETTLIPPLASVSPNQLYHEDAPRANPPQTTPLHNIEESALNPTEDYLTETIFPSEWNDPLWDFRNSRFIN